MEKKNQELAGEKLSEAKNWTLEFNWISILPIKRAIRKIRNKEKSKNKKIKINTSAELMQLNEMYQLAIRLNLKKKIVN